MPIAVADDTAAMAQRKPIGQQPFESPPGGVNLHRRLKLRIMRLRDIRIAAADMSVDNAVLPSVGQVFEKLSRGVRIRIDVGAVREQRMRRPPDLPPFGPKIDISVATDRRIARPFIAREGDEAAILLKFFGQLVDQSPKGIVHLKVVGLMAGRIQEGQVPREIEIFLGCIDPDRFAALSVHVAPIAGDRALADHKRVRDGQDFAIPAAIAHGDAQHAFLGDGQTVDHLSAFPFRVIQGFRQAVDRNGRLQDQTRLGLRRRISPQVFGFQAQTETFTGSAQGRQHCLPQSGRTRHDRDMRRFNDRQEMAGRTDIGQHFEFEPAFAEGLQLQTRRSSGPVAIGDGDCITFIKPIAAHGDRHGPIPRPLLPAGLIFQNEAGPIARLGGDVIRRRRIISLQAAPIV